MEIKIQLDGQKKVSAQFDGFSVSTDQPIEDGGQGTAPGPFDLFLASVGLCAGYYFQSFCTARGISTEGTEIKEMADRDPETHLVSKISIVLKLPKDFPEKYRKAALSAIDQCTVKKHFANPPAVQVELI